MNTKRNKTYRYIFVVPFIIVLLAALAIYFYYKLGYADEPNLIRAFVGVVMPALAMLVLLNGRQSGKKIIVYLQTKPYLITF